MKSLIAAALLLAANHHHYSATGSTVALANETAQDAVAYIAFGADSVVKALEVSHVCVVDAPLNVHCRVPAKSYLKLPLTGRYLNATVSFGAPVGCGTTKAELNVNNPHWFNVVDVSLVDGYSNKVKVSYVPQGGHAVVLGPPAGSTGNEKLLGVYPLGCDICVARQHPPCGMQPGRDGCKAGTQYAPDVPCQYQAKARNDFATIVASLVP